MFASLGSVKELCALAPNNVNTMAVGALSALNLGFDKVKACLVADPDLTDKHLIEIEVTGPFNAKLNQHFKCTTVRSNPAIVGHVTGNQTYESFYYSLLGWYYCFSTISFLSEILKCRFVADLYSDVGVRISR